MKLIDESIEQLIRLAEDAIFDGDFERGKKLLMSGLFEEPGYPRLHHELARLYHYHLDDETLAIRHYRLALRFDADQPDVFRDFQHLLSEKKRFDELMSLLRQAQNCKSIELDTVYASMGWVHEWKGDYREARKHYRMALMHCMDNDEMKELRQNIRRTTFKQLKTTLKSWQRRNSPART